MTSAEYAIVVPLYGGVIVLVVREFFDGIRRVKAQAWEDAKHVDLVTRSKEVKETLGTIQMQTNGNTEKLLKTIADQAVELGRLQGMVQGLQLLRTGAARSTDAPVVSASLLALAAQRGKDDPPVDTTTVSQG